MRFAAVFGIFFLAGSGILLLAPARTVDAEFSRALVWVSQGLIQTCGGQATLEGAILRSPSGFAVEMRDGCNGVNVTILLFSAMLAFPLRGA